MVTGLPEWQGTVIGIDISVDETQEFASLLELIRKSYTIDVKRRKKDFYKKIPISVKTISLLSEVGFFAEDKDAAASLRNNIILPTLKAGEKVVIDFSGITLTTQSFVHALISQALRQEGEVGLEKLIFRNCSLAAKGIVETVVQYVLETVESDEDG